MIGLVRWIVTSAWPYSSVTAFLGNLVGSVLSADAIARYLRLKGHEVIYVSGSDEHGTPVESDSLNYNFQLRSLRTRTTTRSRAYLKDGVFLMITILELRILFTQSLSKISTFNFKETVTCMNQKKKCTIVKRISTLFQTGLSKENAHIVGSRMLEVTNAIAVVVHLSQKTYQPYLCRMPLSCSLERDQAVVL